MTATLDPRKFATNLTMIFVACVLVLLSEFERGSDIQQPSNDYLYNNYSWKTDLILIRRACDADALTALVRGGI